MNPASPAGASSGLLGPSLVKCGNLAAVRQQRVVKIIDQLSIPLMQQVNDCLKAALELT